MNNRASVSPARRAALLGICAALAVAISWLEGYLPAIPIPGAKLGLPNLVIMFVLTTLDIPSAVTVTLAKAGFALFRGVTAGLMSLAGGLLSTVVMAVCLRLFARHVSFIGIGITGALAHNAAQLTVAVWLLGPTLVYYAPWLLLFAILTGSLTGLVLNLVIPALKLRMDKFDIKQGGSSL